MQSQRFLTDVLKREGNNFDVLRLVAALAVIVGHAYAITPQPPLRDGVLSLLHFDYSGSLAVKFFFFLSGLLVTNSIRVRSNPFQFLLKRGFRIFPGLFVCLMVSVFLIGPFFTKLPLTEYFSDRGTWKYLGNNFVLMNMQWRLPGVFQESSLGLNGSLWTLPFEVLCYLFLAVFHGLGLLRNKVISNIFFSLIIVMSFLNPGYLPTFFSQNAESHLLPACFAMGGLFANNKELIPVGVTNLVLIWVLAALLNNSAIFQFLFYIAFFYTAVFIASLAVVRNYLKIPFDASYGVYVYGFVIQQCIFHLFPGLGLHAHQFLASAIAMVFGICSWHFVEKRFIAMGHSITSGSDSLRNKLQKLLQNGWKISRQIKVYRGSDVLIFGILSMIACLVHALALKFIFPGYYSPLFPQHSDFYIPVTFANSTDTFLSLLAWPRPMTMVFSKFIGYFGIHGSIAWIIAIVCMNCALSAVLITRIFKIALTWKWLLAFAIYCYLLFTQPFFYIFYAQDIGAQLSYLFLIAGTYLVYLTFHKPVLVSNSILFVFCLLAFLSKETYGLAALTLGFLWFIYYRKRSLLKALFPILAIGGALFVALIINVYMKSTFVDLNATAGSPYQISFNLKTIFLECLLYAKQAMNVANVAVIIVLGYLLQKDNSAGRTEMLFVSVGCVAAAILSWLPNALLPNHHYTGYSFNGAYLLYLPLLFLTVLWEGNVVPKHIYTGVLVLCLASPIFNISKYKSNEWVLIQENTQRNLLAALGSLIGNIHPAKEPQKILIKGITFPFHPFAFPQSLRVFPNAKYAYFDILNYDSLRTVSSRVDFVRFVNMQDTAAIDYQEKWVFDKDGKLVQEINTLSERIFNRSDSTSQVLEINQGNFDQFTSSGFYAPENNIRWTNGKASIILNNSIQHKDSLIVKLNTFLPPICKDINPHLTLVDVNDREYQPAVSTKKENVFYYLFLPGKTSNVQKINILSGIIDASPDQRTLSFPFISLQLGK